MNGKSDSDIRAIAGTLQEFGKAVAKIGMDKPVSAWTRDEALEVAEVIITAWQRRSLEEDEIPF